MDKMNRTFAYEMEQLLIPTETILSWQLWQDVVCVCVCVGRPVAPACAPHTSSRKRQVRILMARGRPWVASLACTKLNV